MCVELRVAVQVSYHGWNALRFSVQFLSLGCLFALASPLGPLWRTLFEATYHLFATLPVVCQLVASLVRTTIHLTLRRDALGVAYHYLVVKEACRGCIVGALTVGALSLTPRLVGLTSRFKLASLLTLTVFGASNLLFNLAHQAFVRAMVASGMGVPVPIFRDLRHGPPPVGTQAGLHGDEPAAPEETAAATASAAAAAAARSAAAAAASALAAAEAAAEAVGERRRARSPVRSARRRAQKVRS